MASYLRQKRPPLFQGSKQKLVRGNRPELLWMLRGVPLRKELGRQRAFALGPVGKSGATLFVQCSYGATGVWVLLCRIGR